MRTSKLRRGEMFNVQVYMTGYSKYVLLFSHTFGTERAARDYAKCYKPSCGFLTIVKPS
jgi:hypothetical protein